jgi:biopolymer transport protein ExbB
MTALLLVAVDLCASPRNLEDLLDYVRRERTQEKQEIADRESKFSATHNRQKELLQEARDELKEQESRNARLTELHEANERSVEQQRQELEEAVGALSELQATFNSISVDISEMLGNSLISAQHPERRQRAKSLAASDELPSIADVEALWELTLETIVSSGQVVRFPARVVALDGEPHEQEVVRIGSFNIISDGLFLGYERETGKLVEPLRQPSRRHLKKVEHFENATGLVSDVPIDPTRGIVLSLLGQTPDLVTRIRQGGIVGYVIIALGGMGLLIASERFIVLSVMGGRIKRQLSEATPSPGNPLGRILGVHQENPDVDTETLSLKLEEAVLRELPRVQRGLGALSLLAAVAPLMGLLGTVVGIIETFQSITLFGTGDPRLMSGGISLALITTVIGLVVAIPMLFLHSLLSAKSNRIVQTLDEKSAAIVATAAEKSHDARIA